MRHRYLPPMLPTSAPSRWMAIIFWRPAPLSPQAAGNRDAFTQATELEAEGKEGKESIMAQANHASDLDDALRKLRAGGRGDRRRLLRG